MRSLSVETFELGTPSSKRELGISDYRYLRLARRPRYSTSGSIRAVDLFSGVGSLSLGVWEACRQSALELHSTAIDINRYALDVYAKNFPNSRIIAQDVTKLVDGKLHAAPTLNERRLTKFLGPTTLLLSGSPCQGFCPLNNYTRGRDIRNSLYLRATRLAELIRPTHILLENVRDVVNGHVDVVRITTTALRAWGYYVDSGAIDLAELGLPQHRKRHVVAASLKKPISIQQVAAKYKVEKLRTVRWAIEDLEDEYPIDAFTTPSRQSPANRARIRYLFRNRLYDLPNSMRPRCQRNGNHSYKSMYGKLDYDSPAQTVTSGFQSPGQGRFVHPSRERTLTAHEAARLQFFPDFFDFSPAPNRTGLLEMIGNAAPMKLSHVFAQELLD